MKTNHRILKLTALATLLAGSVSVTSAAGLLGQRYVSGTFDWAIPEENAIDDGRGLTALVNQPLSSNIDLSLSYSFLDSGVDVDDGEGGIRELDVSGQNLSFGITYYAPVQTAKAYGRLSVGWLGTQIDGDDENDGIYSLEGGVEIPAGARATLTPFIAWSNTFDDDLEDNGVFTFGALTEFEVSSKWSVLARATIDEDENWGLSGGVAFRF